MRAKNPEGMHINIPGSGYVQLPRACCGDACQPILNIPYVSPSVNHSATHRLSQSITHSPTHSPNSLNSLSSLNSLKSLSPPVNHSTTQSLISWLASWFSVCNSSTTYVRT